MSKKKSCVCHTKISSGDYWKSKIKKISNLESTDFPKTPPQSEVKLTRSTEDAVNSGESLLKVNHDIYYLIK